MQNLCSCNFLFVFVLLLFFYINLKPDSSTLDQSHLLSITSSWIHAGYITKRNEILAKVILKPWTSQYELSCYHSAIFPLHIFCSYNCGSRVFVCLYTFKWQVERVVNFQISQLKFILNIFETLRLLESKFSKLIRGVFMKSVDCETVIYSFYVCT